MVIAAPLQVLLTVMGAPGGLFILSALFTLLLALPVLMLTARGQSRDRDLALKTGASGFIAKPFSNGDILASVQALLEGA